MIKLGKYTIIGNTIGNEATGLIIQDLKIQLDAGFYNKQDISHILITHGHSDHIKAITDIVQLNTKPINIICPPFLEPFLKKFISSYFELNSLNPHNKKIHKITTWNKKINNIDIEFFNVKHTVKCVSYGIIRNTTRIKDEYKHMTSSEIVELKKHTQITHNVKIKEILYITDLDFSSLSLLPFHEYNNIIIECTFWFQEHKIEARKKLHLHWDDIKPIIQKFPLKNFLITHISPRYNKEIDKILHIIKDFTNVSIFHL